MVSANQSKAALTLVATASVGAVVSLFEQSYAQPEQQRAYLLDTVPSAIDYYSAGAAALAADFYDDERELQNAPKLYVAEPIIADRVVNIRRAVAWAADPLFADDTAGSLSRLADVVQLETARPYRDTILTNRRRDPAAVGWRRIARAGSCRFCRMLADRGAVYKRDTARFASHGHCQCGVQPVFSSSDFGEEANVWQYTASQRSRTPRQKEQLREYLDKNYPEGKKASSPFTARVNESKLSSDDTAARLRTQLGSLEKTLPTLRERASAGENLSASIRWQQERIATLRKELSSIK